MSEAAKASKQEVWTYDIPWQAFPDSRVQLLIPTKKKAPPKRG